MKESSNLELKQTVTNTFLKTVSAYANYGTGRILFGVNDNGTEMGLPNPKEACLSIENRINDSIDPVPDYRLEIVGRTGIVSLTVREGLHKPYLYRSKAYRRADTSTIEVDHVELTRLVLEGKNLSYENTPAASQELTFNCLERKLIETTGIEAISSDVLRTLELMDGKGTYNVAGELLADSNERPGIDIVRFGNTISIMLDRESFEHISLLEQYDRSLEVFRRYYCYEEIVGSMRIARERIPEDAFREAVANALVHREWDVDPQIRISMFDDRIEVSSPGGLPHGLSVGEYLEGQISKLRNPILGNVFFRLNIIERFGTGVLRIKDAYRSSATQPQFDVYENSIRVTLPVTQNETALPAADGQVYRVLQGREMPVSEISSEVGFGKTKTQAILKRLLEGGYIEVVGVGRGTKYRARKLTPPKK